MGHEKRRKYDSDFKRRAVDLSNDPSRKVTEVAASLGISAELLYRWRKEFAAMGAIAFPGNGIPALTDEQKRIKDLEKQLRDAEMERDILKKAVRIFSQETK